MSPQLLLARLDRLPVWPYPRRFLWVVGIGFLFAFFDVITIALALPKLEQLFNISMATATWSITSGLIGYIVGSFCIARCSDVMGRRLSLFLSIGFFSIGSILTACSMSFFWVIVFRFFTGVGIGAEIAIISTYLSEMSPACCRGRYTTLAIAWGMLGFAVVPFFGLLLIPHFEWGWRAMFLLGGIGGLFTFWMRQHLPDSPRWLVARGRLDAADAMIQAAERRVSIRMTLPPVPDISQQPEPVRDFRLSQLFKAPYGCRIFLFVALWFVYYIGNYAWLTLAPSLLNEAGFSLSKSLTFVALASTGFVVGALIAAYLGDRIERKWSLSIAGIIWVVTLLCIGWFPVEATIGIAGFLAACTIGFMIPLMYIYTAEHFPTQSRATSVAVTDGLGHLGGAFCGQIVLGIASYFTLPFTAAFTVMSITGVLTILLILSGDRMTGKSLE